LNHKAGASVDLHLYGKGSKRLVWRIGEHDEIDTVIADRACDFESFAYQSRGQRRSPDELNLLFVHFGPQHDANNLHQELVATSRLPFRAPPVILGEQGI
jgi:hypothetical protein